ncbi:MAG: SnoaL-like domain-containing protein [Gemmatimonadaceae bacterium]|nr:SnoaL-like domain-containing protein [Gemmatimonadaceae bacterium]NUQ91267.1 SnoaL-like domain-containing protein [Gemmatimonadaceae bacterium]NUR18282.1 SnoaL-like domain-containing protein [Gemmatimonadaceae bacterium]NUS95902.1 SnoaL-like domain-containing protein [Gemmatimonadaceae bacterium]
MPDTAGIIADLNDLLQLDHDAVEAYTVAIDRVRSERYRDALVQYRNDHKRHIEELAALVRARGGLPTELPHPTGALKLVVQALGSAGNDATLLLAFKAVEGQARDKYRRFAAETDYPEDVKSVIARAAEDETRHYAWVEQTLRELGAGAGTVQHAAASAIEMVHKFIADPLERAERDLMRAVGSVVGTAKSAGERVVADSMRTADAAKEPASKGDTLRFVAALHALEESGDVEGIVSLFDESAEISNPNDLVPHRGAEGARHFWRAYRDSFEEIHSDFSRIVEREGTAMLEWTSTGRIHGHPVTYAGVSVVEMADGRVKRFRAYFDPAKLEAQL